MSRSINADSDSPTEKQLRLSPIAQTQNRYNYKLPLQCDHDQSYHGPFIGKTNDGTYKTLDQSRYPSDMCKKLADLFVAASIKKGQLQETDPQLQQCRPAGEDQPDVDVETCASSYGAERFAKERLGSLGADSRG